MSIKEEQGGFKMALLSIVLENYNHFLFLSC